MEEQAKNSKRKPEQYFTSPGDAYFENVSQHIFSKIQSGNAPHKRSRFAGILKPVALASLIVIAAISVFVLQDTPDKPTASNEEIMLEEIAQRINLNQDFELLIQVTQETNQSDLLQELSDEELDELYNELKNL